MGWLNTGLRIQPQHRAEILGFLGIDEGEPQAAVAIAAVEDSYREAVSIQEDADAEGWPDADTLATVHDLAGRLSETLAGLDEEVRRGLQERYWGAKYRPGDGDVDLRGTAHVSCDDLQRALARLADAAAPVERRGRRRKEGDRILVASLARIWEHYTGAPPEYRAREDPVGGEFGVWVNLVATRAIRYRHGHIDHSIREVLKQS